MGVGHIGGSGRNRGFGGLCIAQIIAHRIDRVWRRDGDFQARARARRRPRALPRATGYRAGDAGRCGDAPAPGTLQVRSATAAYRPAREFPRAERGQHEKRYETPERVALDEHRRETHTKRRASAAAAATSRRARTAVAARARAHPHHAPHPASAAITGKAKLPTPLLNSASGAHHRGRSIHAVAPLANAPAPARKAGAATIKNIAAPAPNAAAIGEQRGHPSAARAATASAARRRARALRPRI